MPNFNPETGVPFGIIAINSLNGDIAHDLLYGGNARDLTYEDFVDEVSGEIRADLLELGFDDGSCDYKDEFERRLEAACCNYECDEPIFAGEREGVTYQTTWLGGAQMLWVFESPRIGRYARCSPCVPGAGNLDVADDAEGIECYDVPVEWREGA